MTKNQQPLFTVKHEAGRHEKMLLNAIEAARDSDRLDATDDGIISLAIANAAALDAAEASGKSFYPIAQLTGPYREVLQALRMTPADREEVANDDLNKALEALGTAEVRDTSA